MEITIELVVDDKLPEGVRRARDGYWKGECLICSRNKIEQALRGDILDVSGVYILFGTKHSEETVYPDDLIYIGSGDSVRDRIQSHSKKKIFWRTAVIFYRPGQELHYGNIRYIEAKLVELAKASDVVLLDNDTSPRLPAMPEAAAQESEQFVERIVLYLRALGLDFFSVTSQQPIEKPDELDVISDVPLPLRAVVASLMKSLEDLPQTTFYATKSPDVRAKVAIGDRFRVFARIKYRADGVRLELKNVDHNIFVQKSDLTAPLRLREQIQLAHKLALNHLAKDEG